MRSILRIKLLALLLCLFLGANYSMAQLLYEGMVFDGMDRPLLDNASSVAVSPDGEFVYASSFNDNAVTVYSRDVSGSPGALTFVETQKNEVEGIVGMNGVYHLALSPDGNHLYVAGSSDDAIVVFNRNAVTGALVYSTTYWNNVDGIEGLDEANFISIPADGNNVYVAGPGENAVAVFKRNVINGTLTFVEMQQDESGDVTQMNYPLSVMNSPDGKHVYVTSFGDNAVNVFSRNLTTGALTFVEHHKEGVGGISGLSSAYSPYVTPDGLQVYVSGLYSDAIVAFNRDPSSGELSYVDTYVDNTDGVDGLSGPQVMRVSPDGNYFYVAASNEDAIGVFNRNADSGELTFLTMVQEGVGGVTGIAYPTYIDISEDGANLYVTGFASASLAVFNINNLNGGLVFQNAETGNGQGVSGLDGSEAVTVSPDGNFVYAAGNNDDAIVVFERNTTTGALEFVQKIEDSSTTDGLNGINCIAISPDGNYLYTTGLWDKSVVLFERNTMTGELTYVERYKDNISGVDGLNGANFITVSPDGNTVYTTGFWEHAVSVFERNTSNGTLTFVEVFKDGASGVDGLNRASGVTVSPDNSSVYVVGNYDNAVAVFDRDLTDGTLTFNSVLKDGVDGVDGIQRATSVAVSPDNAQVYVTGESDDALAMFNRDASTGVLTYVGQMKNGVGGVEGMDGPGRIAMSPNGEHIYVTTKNDNALVAFRRNVGTGELIYEAAVFDSDPGVNGLGKAFYVTVSPDGKNMYAAAKDDDAIAIFSCTYIFDMDEVICEGDSVVVGSTSYLESGTYIDTFSFGACKTVTTLQLLVQPAVTFENAEICNGDTYLFNGGVYSSTGAYNANLTSSHGCDSTITLNLTVVSEFSDQDITASICAGESYPWDGGVVSTAGNYTQTYTTSFGCDSTVTLNLTVNEVYNETINAEICEGDFYVLGTQNYIASGTFVEPFVSQHGCDSIITLNLSVVEPETVMNETICDGDVLTIGTNTFTEAGTYNFTLESGAGCDSEVTLNLSVNNTWNTNLNEIICEGENIIIGTSTYSNTGVYTDVLAAANGCDSTVVLDLTVIATSVELSETICEGDSYMVGTTIYTTTGVHTTVLASTMGCGDSTIVLNLNVEPTEASVFPAICEGEAYEFAGVSYTETGVYMTTVTSDAGCETAYTIDLTVNAVYDFDVDADLCAGETITVGGQVYDETGNYIIPLTSSTGCDSIINLSVLVSSLLDVTEAITDDNGTGLGAIDLTIAGGIAPYTFMWSNGETTEDVSELPTGTYTVAVTDANGCTTTLTYFVDQVDATFEVGADISLKIYPNPAPAGGHVNLSFDINQSQTLKLQLFDSVGKRISGKTVDLLSGNTVHSMKLPEVQGLYQLYIETEDGKYKTIQLSVK